MKKEGKDYLTTPLMNTVTMSNSNQDEDEVPITLERTDRDENKVFGKKKWIQKLATDTHTNVYNMSELIGQEQETAKSFIEMNLDKVIDFVGAESNYQNRLTVQACMMSVVMSMILYSQSFLITTPEFQCPTKSGVFKNCSEPEWCSQVYYKDLWANDPNNIYEQHVNWQYPGWTKTHHEDMICDYSNNREIFNYIIIFIAAIIMFSSQVLSDSMGRVYILKFFTYSICTIAIIGYFFTNIWIKVITMAIFVGEEQTVVTLFTYIINESTSSKSPWRSRAIGIYFCCFGLGGILISLISYVVTNPDTLYLIIVLMCTLFSLPMMWTLKETPKQLHKRGQFFQLITNLLYISKVNKKEVNIQELAENADLSGVDVELIRKCKIETRITCGERLQSVMWNFSILFSSEYGISLIGYLLLCGCLRTINNCASFSADEIGPHLQINVILLSTMEAFSYLMATFVAAKMPRKKCSIFCLLGI